MPPSPSHWIYSRDWKFSKRNGKNFIYRRNKNSKQHMIELPPSVKAGNYNGARRFFISHFNTKNVGPHMNPFEKSSFNFFTEMTNVHKLRNSFFQRVTNNGRSGFKMTVAANGAGIQTKNNGSRVTWKHGISRLGQGKQGVVYLAYKTENITKPIAIKVSPMDMAATAQRREQPAVLEERIQRALYAVVPKHIPQVFGISQAKNFVALSEFKNMTEEQNIFFMEYVHGGSMGGWMKKVASILNDDALCKIIKDIVGALKKIAVAYPDFRHNDLHLENVMIDDTKPIPRALIGDLGWARMLSKGKNNPIVFQNKSALKYGIGQETDPRYDLHLFLYCVNQALPSTKCPKTHTFLRRIMPAEYYKMEGAFTRSGRLIYNPGHGFPGMPTINQVYEDSYLKSALNFNVAPRRNSPRAAPRNVSAPAPRNVTAPAPRNVPKTPNHPKVNSTRVTPSPSKSKMALPKHIEHRLNSLAGRLLPKNFTANEYERVMRIARARAIKITLARLNAGKPAFSPVKLPNKPRVPNKPANKPANSGRKRFVNPLTGRMVFANSATVTKDILMAVAKARGLAVTGTKANIIARLKD